MSKKWRHIGINALRSWLPGDARGFRNRGHRLHSSGDYQNPPPPHEHEGLRRYVQSRARNPVQFSVQLRTIIGVTLIKTLQAMQHRVLAVSVGKDHAHILTELPNDISAIKSIIGQCKRRSSRAVKKWLPGSIWSAGGSYKRIKDRAHQLAVFDYILTKQGPGAWTWSFRNPLPDTA